MKSPKFRWRVEHTLVVLATLLAAILRFTALGTLPPQAWIDEVWVSSRAYDIIHTGQIVAHYGLKARGGGGDAGLAWLAVVPELLGIQSIIASRVVTAVAGMLAVPVTYACLRELLAGEGFEHRRWTAALAAGGLSYLLYQVILSRVGMEAGSMPVMYIFCVWQLQRGLRRGAWSGWALAGLVGGAMQYAGPHTRFILPVMAFMIVQAFATALPLKRTAIARGTALLTVIGVGVCGWLIATFIQTPALLIGRGETVTQGVLHGGPLPPVLAVSLNALRMLASFNIVGDMGVRHNLPGAPMLDPVMSAGFIAGAIWAAASLRRSALARLLLAWLVLLMIPSIITVGAPNFERTSGIAGAALGLMAVGWGTIAERLRVRLAHWVLGALAATSVGWNVIAFFVLWPQSPNLQEDFTAQPAVALHDLADRSARQPVYIDIIPGRTDLAALDFIFRETPAKRVSLQDCLPLVDGAPTPVSYAVNSYQNVAGAHSIREVYPTSQIVFGKLSLWEEGNITQMDVPAGAKVIQPSQHPSADFGGVSLYGYDWIESDRRPGGKVSLAVVWKVMQPITQDLTSFYHIQPAIADEVAPSAQYDGPPCAGTYSTTEWQPGMLIKDWITIKLPADLPAGDYELLVGWYVTATQTRIGVRAADNATPSGRVMIGTFKVTNR